MTSNNVKEQYPTLFFTDKDKKTVDSLNTALLILLKNELLESTMSTISNILENVDPFSAILRAKNDEISDRNDKIKEHIKAIKELVNKVTEQHADILSLISDKRSLKISLYQERKKKFNEATQSYKDYKHWTKKTKNMEKRFNKVNFQLENINSAIRARKDYVNKIEMENLVVAKRLSKAAEKLAELTMRNLGLERENKSLQEERITLLNDKASLNLKLQSVKRTTPKQAPPAKPEGRVYRFGGKVVEGEPDTENVIDLDKAFRGELDGE